MREKSLKYIEACVLILRIFSKMEKITLHAELYMAALEHKFEAVFVGKKVLFPTTHKAWATVVYPPGDHDG